MFILFLWKEINFLYEKHILFMGCFFYSFDGRFFLYELLRCELNIIIHTRVSQSAGAVEYTDCASAEG